MPPLNRLTRRGFLGRTCAAAAAGFFAPQLAAKSAAAAPAGGQDEGWQIGCWTRPWAKHDYRVAMDAVAEAGYKHISFTGAKTKTGRVIAAATPIDEAQRAGEEAKKRGLKISFVYGGGLPLHKGSEPLRRMIDNCAAAEGRSIIIAHLGNEKTVDLYCKAIAECCDYAAEKHVGLTVKPHGGMTATGPLCRKAVEQVGHESFTMVYDPGNVLYYSNGQINPVEDAATVDGLVTGMSVKDYKHPKNVAVTPGTGEVDFPALMGRLRSGGFTHGPLSVEMLDPGDSAKTLKEAVKARKFLEQLLGIE